MTVESVEAAPAGVFQTLRETSASVHYVLLGVFVNQFGAFLRAFLVLYLTTARGFSASLAGIALGCYSVGAIFGSILGGTLSDRLGPRWTIAGTMSLAALFTLSVTVLGSFPLIVAAAALSGAMTNASSPAASSLLLGMVPQARQVMVFAMYRTALNAGVVVGPLVAVWLSTISWNLVFYVDAATAVGYALIAAVLLRDENAAAPEESEESAPASTRSRYATMLSDGRYLAYLGLMLANGLVHIQFWVVLPLMVVAEGYPTWVYGAAAGVSAFVVDQLRAAGDQGDAALARVAVGDRRLGAARRGLRRLRAARRDRRGVRGHAGRGDRPDHRRSCGVRLSR